jgi:hypothetical protein
MKLSPIIYLDTSFITDAYEAFSGKPVPVKVVKSENITGGLSAGIFNAGASTQETKEFSTSPHAMYEEMRSDLDTFPEVDLGSTEPRDLPECFWTNATFSVGSSQVSRGNQVTHQESHFRLYAPDEAKKGVYMLTSETYFATGYEQVLRHVHGETRGFGIQVRALVRLLAIQEANFWPLCTPFVMVKTGNV